MDLSGGIVYPDSSFRIELLENKLIISPEDLYQLDKNKTDIFLANQCKFYICTDSGISIVPQCFRKPIVFVNFPSIRRIYLHNLESIVILKNFYCFNTLKALTGTSSYHEQ